MVPVKSVVKSAGVPLISTCYCLEFRCMKRDRVSYFGRGDMAQTAVNVRCYPRMLSDQPADVHFIPRVAKEEDHGDAEGAEDPAEDEGADTIGIQTNMFRGWKTSYKLDRSKEESYKVCRAKLQRKCNALSDDLFIGEATRRTSTQTLLDRNTAKKAAAKKYGKTHRDCLKAKDAEVWVPEPG